MDLPDPDRQLLDPAPVRRVVCQLRFDSSEIAGSSQNGRVWAETLSDDYPRFEQLQGELLTIQGGANQFAPRIDQSQERGWRFSDDDQKTLVTLLPASLALETTVYAGWSDFANQFERLLSLLHDTVNPAVEQRIGLRYINELSAGPGEVAGEVDREVLGLRAHPDISDGIAMLEQRATIDLADRRMAALRFLSGRGEEPSILDIDAYREAGKPFSADAVRSVLDELNTGALSLFQACLSDDYLARLRDQSGE